MIPPETTVVNLRKEKCDVKIGRNSKGKVPPVPQPGCFGNPYSVEEYGRDNCIAMFRDYFYKRIEEDQEFREAILALKGKRLGCFCHPQLCHGDIIRQWLDQQEVLPKL
jgi:hypothetical protein